MRSYTGYIFDLDGTIYLDDRLLPGAQEVITALRGSARRLVIVTNNPTVTRDQLQGKLNRLGVEVSINEVINSSFVLINHLLDCDPGAVLYPVGEPSLHRELQAAGFEISQDPARIEYVIASFDRTFEYRKLKIAFDAIRRGAHFIATNADRFCPTLEGGEPDAAAVIAAIEACTSTRVELVLGKPSIHMARAALQVLQTEPQHTLLIGDRLETDIQMGNQAGMDTALILTGATHRAQLEHSAIQPTYVVSSLLDLLPGQP